MKQVEILGYVNCVGMPSEVMNHDTRGQYVEVIQSGAFQYALMLAEDIPILVDHKKNRKIASLKDGVNYLFEDGIGLKISVNVSDLLVIKAAKSRKVKGWSFTFQSLEDSWHTDEKGNQIRTIKKMKLEEISLVVNQKPLYSKTTWEIKGQPFTPSVAQKIELDLMNKEFEILKLRGRFSYDGN